MPHIHTGPGEHDHTVSAYIVRLDRPEPVLILHKHKLLKTYLQFGGHIELNENPWTAITHELAEETGYTLKQLKLIQPAIRLKELSGVTLHPYPISLLTHKFGETDHYHTDIAYAFVTHESPKGKIGKGESVDIQEFTARELRTLQLGSIPEDVREIGLFVLEDCLKEWRAINAVEIAL